MRLWSLMVLVLVAMAPGFSETDLIYPWVTNNATFGGTVVVNNLNSEAVEVTMTATRQDGSSQTVTHTIGALEQLISGSTQLFQELGEGGGYSIRLRSAADNVTGGFVVTGTQSASGSSPSQANVFAATEAANIILFNFFTNASGFSAPVVVNPGDQAATVTFHVFSNGVKTTYDPIVIEAGRPLADITSTLFGDILGDFFLVAEATLPILGTAFIFNDQLEPSMANAVPVAAVPEPASTGTVSFVNQIIPIFQASCGNGACHLGGSQAQGLNLDDDPYDTLLSRSSIATGAPLITPGDLSQSYLYQKILSRAEGDYFGERMPRGRPALSDDSVALIRTWIEEGANH